MKITVLKYNSRYVILFYYFVCSQTQELMWPHFLPLFYSSNYKILIIIFFNYNCSPLSTSLLIGAIASPPTTLLKLDEYVGQIYNSLKNSDSHQPNSSDYFGQHYFSVCHRHTILKKTSECLIIIIFILKSKLSNCKKVKRKKTFKNIC